jgi:hypothetical protein
MTFTLLSVSSIGNSLMNSAASAISCANYVPADAIGFVQKEFPVAEGLFHILVDRHDDCLDVLPPPNAGSRNGKRLCKQFVWTLL